MPRVDPVLIESDATAVVGRLVARWPAARAFVLVGCGSIVAGGLIAAVSRPTGLEQGSWLAAYLVLVGGVAQIGLGGGQAWMAASPPGPSVLRSEVAAWNLALVATIVGSLASMPVLSTLGSASTIVALVLFLLGVRRGSTLRWWPLVVYRCVIVVVLLSTPIGLALAWARHG